MADLIVPFIVFGAPLAAAAAPEEAAGATTVGAADLVANLFGLAA
jgi:hypothetical protein